MSESNSPSVSLVIPCYNEESRLQFLIDELEQFSEIYPGDLEFILVNDGSQDGTGQVLETLKTISPQYKIIQYERNRGKGYALKQGVQEAKGEFIVTLDADLSAHPDTFTTWMKKYPIDKTGIYIGSREHEDSDISALELRRWSGRLFNLWVRFRTGIPIKDTQCGFQMLSSQNRENFVLRFENLGMGTRCGDFVPSCKEKYNDTCISTKVETCTPFENYPVFGWYSERNKGKLYSKYGK